MDIGKLVPIPADLSKLSNVVKNYIVKKVDDNKLVTKVNNINTSDFVLKTNCNTKITELENEKRTNSNNFNERFFCSRKYAITIHCFKLHDWSLFWSIEICNEVDELSQNDRNIDYEI